MSDIPPTSIISATDTVDDAASLERGRLLFAQECNFLLGVANLDQIPESNLTEIAFAGRSNVGKSSLTNALTGRNTLARTSNQPGRTQQLNFFELGGRLMLVDMPGYGFARAPKQLVARWTGLVKAYLRGRAVLRRCCLLIDARHGIKDIDREVMAMLDTAAVNYQIVLTKADKLKGAALTERLQDIAVEIAKHPAAHPNVSVTSARENLGIAELRATLAALALPAETR
jgi:GTP-binding protein